METNGILKERLLNVLEQETGEDIETINPDQDITEQVSLDSLQLVFDLEMEAIVIFAITRANPL